MDNDPVAAALVRGAKSYIDSILSPVLQRLAALEAREVMPGPPGRDGINGIDGCSIDPEQITTFLGAQIERIAASLPPGPAGRDGVDGAAGRDGKSADPGEVAEILRSQIEEPLVQRVADAIASIPEIVMPKDGVDGRDGVDGQDGKSVDPEELGGLIDGAVERVVAALPAAKDGVDGRDADPVDVVALVEPMLRAMATEMIAELPVAKDGVDGKDADPEEMQRTIVAEVTRQFEATPKPRDGLDGINGKDGADGRDGIGFVDAIIDREGKLTLVRSDGGLHPVAVVVGKDADMEALAALIVSEIAKMPRPRDGKDGFSLTDFKMEYDGERTFTARFISGDLVYEESFAVPFQINKEIWKEGSYVRGDVVIRDGSNWHCRRDTTAMPGASPDWLLSVKKGRDGKNTETVKIMPPTVKRDDPEKT